LGRVAPGQRPGVGHDRLAALAHEPDALLRRGPDTGTAFVEPVRVRRRAVEVKEPAAARAPAVGRRGAGPGLLGLVGRLGVALVVQALGLPAGFPVGLLLRPPAGLIRSPLGPIELLGSLQPLDGPRPPEVAAARVRQTS
jgi:hypothetical protein